MKQDKVTQTSGTDQFAIILKFDSRVTNHNKRLGILTDSEIKDHMATLPDSSANLDHVRIEDLGLNGSAQ